MYHNIKFNKKKQLLINILDIEDIIQMITYKQLRSLLQVTVPVHLVMIHHIFLIVVNKI